MRDNKATGYGQDSSGQPTECRHCRYPATIRKVAIETTFWLLMGCNVGCEVGEDMLFDSRGWVLRSSYPVNM